MLNFLRSGDLPPRERVRAVYKEAQYYAIGPLLEQLENMQPLKGEKVRQAFLGLMPYYKGEGLTAWHSWGVRKEGCQASISAEVSPRRGVPGVHLDTCHPPTHTGRFGDPGPTLPAVSSNRISKGRTQEFPSWFSG